MIRFTANEILKVAENIEANGVKFYRLLASKAKTKVSKEVFLHLSEMEKKHEKTFAAMRAKLSVKDKESDVYDPNNEVAMYLKALADGSIFDMRSPQAVIKAGKTLKGSLKLAIALEKDSVVFYTSLKSLVPKKLGTAKVDTIIKEEMCHITTLARELAAIKR